MAAGVITGTIIGFGHTSLLVVLDQSDCCWMELHTVGHTGRVQRGILLAKFSPPLMGMKGCNQKSLMDTFKCYWNGSECDSLMLSSDGFNAQNAPTVSHLSHTISQRMGKGLLGFVWIGRIVLMLRHVVLLSTDHDGLKWVLLSRQRESQDKQRKLLIWVHLLRSRVSDRTLKWHEQWLVECQCCDKY